MKPGSVIVDLAIEGGGNCALSAYDQVIVRNGVTIVGHANYPARVPVDTSTLYARNLFNFIEPMINRESRTLDIDWEDEVIRGALLTKGRRGGEPGAPGQRDLAVEHVLELHPLVIAVTIFVLAVFIGYYVVWSVTPALHTPLMSVTNAISSVIIVGALLAATPAEGSVVAKIFGGVAVGLAAVNIFGGFTVTQRMLSMFKKK